MVPAAIIITVVGAVFLLLWVEDRKELRRVKRDVVRLRERIERLERVAADKPQ